MTGKTPANGYNSQGWFDASTISRCDKIDFYFNLPVDSFNDHYERLQTFFDTVEDKYEKATKTSHLQAMGADNRNGTRMYMVETWGAFSEFVLREIPHEWQTFISRLDYRLEIDIADERLTNVYNYISQNQTKARNLQIFDTRPRDKKEGRNAGGKGLAVGSHKSDTRLAIYKRTGERGAIEWQFKGKALAKILDAARTLRRAEPSFDFHTCTHLAMQQASHNFSLECGFGTVQDVVEAVLDMGDTNYRQMDDVQTIRNFKGVLDRMAKQERTKLAWAIIAGKDIAQMTFEDYLDMPDQLD